MDTFISHHILYFASSSIILVLGFLLLGVRIPKEENLRALRSGKIYLSLAYFILAVSGFSSYFMQAEDGSQPIRLAFVLFIAIFQALLFTKTTLTFIQTSIDRKRSFFIQLATITIIGILLIGSSILSPNLFFPPVFCVTILLYLFQLGFYTYLFRKEYRKTLNWVESYYEEEEDKRLAWIRFCFYSAVGIGLLALISLFIDSFLFTFFILIYTAYYSYMVYRFYNYVTDMRFLVIALPTPETAIEENVVGDSLELTEEEKLLFAENVQSLKLALEKWVVDKRYCQKDIGIDETVRELGTNRNFLRYYCREYLSTDFRTWRSELRIVEAKRLLREHPNMTLNMVASHTGFNHRANLYQQFQKIAGQTPGEYRKEIENQS